MFRGMRRWALAAAVLGLMAGRASAVQILDQQNVVSTTTGYGFYAVGNDFSGQPIELAQTFTVGVGGILARLELQVNVNIGGAPLQVKVYSTSGGLPNPSATLASFTFAASAVPNSPSQFLGVDLGASAFAVAAGDVLAFGLSAPGGQGVFEYNAIFNTSAYARGSAFAQVPPSPGFTPLGQDDLGFRTFVEVGVVNAVPEPSVVVLTASALPVGLLASRRRRKVATA